jgi:peptidoglycan-N-acetylglucosamine deacetylase
MEGKRRLAMRRNLYKWIGGGVLGIGLLAAVFTAGYHQEPLRKIQQSSPLNQLPHAASPEVQQAEPAPAPKQQTEIKQQMETQALGPEWTSTPLPGKIAYLTFDDGPSRSTPRILAALREQGVKATFFVVGKVSEESKALYRQMAEEGHALGNHTYSHDYRKIYSSVEAFRQDVERLNDLLEETAGVRPTILRFPGGSNNHLSRKSGGRQIMPNIAREMSKSGYQYFDWNVSSTDAAAPVQDKEMIIYSVKANSDNKNEIIILMHDMDAKTTTVEALPEVIRYLKEQGYAFRTLEKTGFTFQFLKP